MFAILGLTFRIANCLQTIGKKMHASAVELCIEEALSAASLPFLLNHGSAVILLCWICPLS